MISNTETYARLVRATGDSPRHRAWAGAAFADLEAIAAYERPELPIARTTLRSRRAMFRRAGLAPITEASGLATLARDIGAPTRESLARLLWVLNADRQGRRAKVEARYAVLIADAIGLLGTTPAT